MSSDSLFTFATLALAQPAKAAQTPKIVELADSDDESTFDSLFDATSDASTDPSSLCTDDCCAEPPIKPSPATPSLPPELLLQILTHVLSSALYEPFVVNNQFARLQTTCRPCTHRNLCLVSRQFHELVQEVGARHVVLDRREGGVRDDSAVVRRVVERGQGGWVRSVDASLRGSNGVGPVPAQRQEGGEEGEREGEAATIVEKGERERQARCERSRDTLLQLLEVTPRLQALDVDLSFHAGVLKPGVVPASLRKLTLRNAEPTETFALLARLPNLTDLTLRLVLDFYLPESSEVAATNALSSFELSITGWGETDSHTIGRLLAGSRNSLMHLTVRNKAAVSLPSLLPVCRDLIATYGSQLETLAVKDIPHGGVRPKNKSALSNFFPPKPPALSCLRRLHLTGLPYSPAFLASLGPLPALAELMIENFDEPDGQSLLSCLATPQLQRLQSLSICNAVEWEDDERVVEAWCEERGVALEAGWQRRRVHARWWS